jgi:protein-tyrosine phosphatase
VLDLHCHLLPAVDDGSRSVGQSVKVLLAFESQGITGVCLTPHLLASEAAAGVPAVQQAAFKKLAPAVPEGMRLMRGAEIMLDRPMGRAVARDRVVTLNGSRYILVEFPRQVAPTTVVDALDLVLAIGLVPVVAHPERYSCCEPARARRWREMGARLQLDGPTLLMPRTRGHRARELLSHGLCDIVAGDNHGDDRSLGPVGEALRGQGASEQAELLLTTNPTALVEDRDPEEVPPFALRLPLVDRMRKLFGHNKEERG